MKNKNHITSLETQHSALPTYLGIFSPNNSRKTPIARPLRRCMVVFRAFLFWLHFYIRIYCVVCSIVLYRTAIYRESLVFHHSKIKHNKRWAYLTAFTVYATDKCIALFPSYNNWLNSYHNYKPPGVLAWTFPIAVCIAVCHYLIKNICWTKQKGDGQ